MSNRCQRRRIVRRRQCVWIVENRARKVIDRIVIKRYSSGSIEDDRIERRASLVVVKNVIANVRRGRGHLGRTVVRVDAVRTSIK